MRPITVHFGNRLPIPEVLPVELQRAISAYVPEVVLKKLQVGQNEWIGELRSVSILFVGIHRSCMKSLELMNQCIMAIQVAIYRHEGQINKIIFDDKG